MPRTKKKKRHCKTKQERQFIDGVYVRLPWSMAPLDVVHMTSARVALTRYMCATDIPKPLDVRPISEAPVQGTFEIVPNKPLHNHYPADDKLTSLSTGSDNLDTTKGNCEQFNFKHNGQMNYKESTCQDIKVIHQTFTGTNSDVSNTFNAMYIETFNQTLISNTSDLVANANKTEINNCLPPVKTFVGREEDLRNLTQLLEERRVVPLVGVGGVGKTQLAQKYATDNTTIYTKCIYWLEAETTAILEKSINELAVELGVAVQLSEIPRGRVDILKAVYSKFTEGRSLLIFDNIVKTEDIYPYLPATLGMEHKVNLHILITTRRSNWNRFDIKLLSINPLPLDIALEMFKKSFQEDYYKTPESEWTKLVEMLGYLPLALQAAVGYVKYYDCPVKDYIEQLQKDSDDLLGDPLPEYKNRSIYVSIMMSVKQLEKNVDSKSKLAVYLLNVAAYFNPNGIWIRQLVKLVDDDDDNNKVGVLNNVLVIVKDFSLMTKVSDDQYSMHRIIQKSIRHKQKRNGTANRYFTDALHYVITTYKYKQYVMNYVDERAPVVLKYYNSHPSTELLQSLVRKKCFEALEAIFETWNKEHIKSMITEHGLLISSAESRDVRMVKMLCQFGADINQKDEFGNTPLRIACTGGCTDIVEYLLEIDADPRISNVFGQTAFHGAAQATHPDTLSLLLNEYKDAVNLTDNKGRTLLHTVFCNPVYDDDVTQNYITSTVRVLIRQHGASISDVDSQGWTVIHYAAKSAQAQLVSLILQMNETLVQVLDNDGRTALHVVGDDFWCADECTWIEDTVRVLIDHGLSFHMKDNHGRTPLDTVTEVVKPRLQKLAEQYENKTQNNCK